MNRHHSTTNFLVAFSVVLLVLTFTPLCFAQAKAADKSAAQAPAQRQIISLQFVRLKTGMQTEWREFRKNETLPTLQKGGAKQSALWGMATFGESGSFLIVGSPQDSLAEYDNPTPLQRGLGQEGAAAYNAKNARLVESVHIAAIETRPDLSLPPKPDYQAKFMVVTTTTIEQGYNAEYENFLKTQVLPAIKKAAPKGYLVAQVVYGGNLNQYIGAVMLDSFADLQKYREALNKEIAAAKITGKGAGIVSRENATYRFVPELSIVPTPAK